MELDFLVSLEDENMGQARRSIDADFDDLAAPTSDKTMDLHLSSVSLDPLYLGVLLCLGSWYLVGFSAPIQWASVFLYFPCFLINAQARRTSVVPEDYTKTFGSRQKDFRKAFDQLFKECLHSSRCNDTSEANLATEEENNGSKPSSGENESTRRCSQVPQLPWVGWGTWLTEVRRNNENVFLKLASDRQRGDLTCKLSLLTSAHCLRKQWSCGKDIALNHIFKQKSSVIINIYIYVSTSNCELQFFDVSPSLHRI